MKREMIKLNKVKIAHSEEEVQELLGKGYLPVAPDPGATVSEETDADKPVEEEANPEEPDQDESGTDEKPSKKGRSTKAK